MTTTITTTEARIDSVRQSIANWRETAVEWRIGVSERGISDICRAYRHEQAALAEGCANAAESSLSILFE